MEPNIFEKYSLSKEILEKMPVSVLVSIILYLVEQVRLLKETVEKQQLLIEQLEAKLNQNSSNSNKPPSSDNPFKNTQDKPSKKSKSRRKRKGHRQQCLRPTEVIELFPTQCECGGTEFYDFEPYYIHQFIELPPTELIVKHIGLNCGRCSCCGKLNKALVPPENRAGFGPRISALIAELCGAHGDSRRAVQDFLFSVFDLPISQGGIQKILDRVSTAIEPHYEAIGDVAQSAAVNHIDETSWRTKNVAGVLGMWISWFGGIVLLLTHSNHYFFAGETFSSLMPLLTRMVGLFLFMLGGSMYYYTIIVAGKYLRPAPSGTLQEHMLINKGPFAIIRHPLYVSYVLISLGLGLVFFNFLPLFSALLLLVGIYPTAKAEENVLTKQLGKEYIDYQKQVGMFFPRLFRW